MDREKVIRGLRDIDMFIAGRLEHEKAKNFLRTIDETIALLKEQEAVVRCKDCAYLNRDTRFMNYGYCSYFKDEFYAKVKPDKNFYCGAGKRSVK